MAGSERGGLDHADAGSVHRTALAARVPAATASDAARRVERFVVGLGALPQWIGRRGRTTGPIAFVSHLPQIVSPWRS